MIDGGQVDTLDSEATSYNGDPIVVQAIACKGQSDELSLVAYDISGSMLGSFDFSDLPDINLGSAERLTISSVTGSYVDVVLLDDEAMKESEFHFFFDGETFRIL